MPDEDFGLCQALTPPLLQTDQVPVKIKRWQHPWHCTVENVDSNSYDVNQVRKRIYAGNLLCGGTAPSCARCPGCRFREEHSMLGVYNWTAMRIIEVCN